jgi:hypothetical protein
MNTACLQYVYLYVYSQAMRNRFYEDLRQSAKDYHRSHSLGVDASGIYTRHVFEPERLLSWWDDIGFILNNRRVMIWWVHPRLRYSDAVKEASWKAAGEFPRSEEPIPDADPQFRRVGRSRKKVISYLSRQTSPLVREFYDRVSLLQEQLAETGIDHFVGPSFEVGHYCWGTGVELCAPNEIRTHADAVALVALARRLLKRQTTCAIEFGDYGYGKADWLREADARAADTERRRTENANSG